MSEYKELVDALNFKKEKIPRDRRIFLNLNLIESFLNTGITIKSLVDDLNENGFSIEYNDFKSGLTRARRKLKTQGGNKTDIKTNGIKKPDIIKPTAGVINNSPIEEIEETNISENEDSPIKKHLSMQEKAALSVAALGVNTEETNPLLKRLNQKSKDK